jgi:hypothetical protein
MESYFTLNTKPPMKHAGLLQNGDSGSTTHHLKTAGPEGLPSGALGNLTQLAEVRVPPAPWFMSTYKDLQLSGNPDVELENQLILSGGVSFSSSFASFSIAALSNSMGWYVTSAHGVTRSP